MKKLFVRALIISALLQFIVTRARAGRVEEEGEAELLWVRYPFVVVMNALMWSLILAGAGRAIRVLRPGP